MLDSTNSQVIERLQATSYALDAKGRLREIADHVASWDKAGAGRKDIDKRIVVWMEREGFGFTAWMQEPDIKELAERFPELNWRAVWNGYGIEKWVKECVWSIALLDEPIPFLPFAMGYMYDDRSDHDFPLVIAVMTPLTDVELAVSQIRNKLNKEFGERAVKSNRKDEVQAARMLSWKQQGMSLRDIAIQMLREAYPDIVSSPWKYKTQIAAEKSRIAKRIKSAEEVWKQRRCESSTPD